MAKKKTGSATDLPDATIRDLTLLFGLLADPHRLHILLILAGAGEAFVSRLADELGLPQPTLSHHLSLLRIAGVVRTRREGKRNYYSLNPDAFGDALASALPVEPGTPRRFRVRPFTLEYRGK